MANNVAPLMSDIERGARLADEMHRASITLLQEKLAASEAARREAETRAGGFERQRNELRAIKAELDILLASERAAREKAEAERDELKKANGEAEAAFVAELEAKRAAEARAQKAETERDEARRAIESCTPGGSEFVNDPKACAAFITGARDRAHEMIKRGIVRANAAESRLAAAEKDRDREIEARRAAERATENHAAFALRTVEAEQNLAAAEAALREIAGEGLPIGSLPVCHRCKSLRGIARAYLAGGKP